MESLICSCGFSPDDHDDFIPGYWLGDTYVDGPVCHDCVISKGILPDIDGDWSLEVV